jgi:hypothetical protein
VRSEQAVTLHVVVHVISYGPVIKTLVVVDPTTEIFCRVRVRMWRSVVILVTPRVAGARVLTPLLTSLNVQKKSWCPTRRAKCSISLHQIGCEHVQRRDVKSSQNHCIWPWGRLLRAPRELVARGVPALVGGSTGQTSAWVSICRRALFQSVSMIG